MSFCCEDGQTLDQAAQRACGASVPGDTENLSGQALRNLALAEPASAGRLDWATSRACFQSQ